MEKLKVKHDHTLTDIIKVAIFALFLILPILVFLPNCLYYGFNEHAVVNAETKEVYEEKHINFNQLLNLKNTNPRDNGLTWETNEEGLTEISGTSNNTFSRLFLSNNFSSLVGHKIYLRSTSTAFTPYLYLYDNAQTITANVITTLTSTGVNSQLRFYTTNGNTYDYLTYFNIFDLTQMFGAGNEPTKQEFDTWLPNNYYEYTLNEPMTLTIDTGETKNFTDIASNITNAWQDTWDTPMLQWTNTNTFRFTVNAFVNVFGITPESKMANYLTYILVVTCIYLVFDIVLTLTTKLTHLINEK